MAQATRIPNKNKQRKAFSSVNLRLREAILIVALALACYLLLALVSYQPTDPGWSTTGMGDTVINRGGIVGAWLADALLYIFGLSAYLSPAMLVVIVWLLFSWGRKTYADSVVYFWILRIIGLLMILVATSGMATFNLSTYVGQLPNGLGGALGKVVGNGFIAVFGISGSGLLFFAMLLAGATLFLGLSWLMVIDWLGAFAMRVIAFISCLIRDLNYRLVVSHIKQQRETTFREKNKKNLLRDEIHIAPVADEPIQSKREQQERQVPLFKVGEERRLPTLLLLDKPDNIHAGYSEEVLQALSRQVELKLKDFNVDVQVVEVQPGPVVTRFGLNLAPGIRVSRISGLAKDLARALSVSSVRIVEVIPGKPVVGLEIPNEVREIVRLREILGAPVYEESKSLLMMAIGKGVSGHPVAVDLEKMPHLLAAGTTGSGKSVALNAMILSLLYKATPEQVRMIMIDPKMLELSVYEDIPHLLTPVVTDMKEAANALRWCVTEMERRYQLMATMGVRHISGYNKTIKQALDSGEPIIDSAFELIDGQPAQTLTNLPFVVVIIDELADMMMVVGKQVEEMIARLAQKARASGIHLILATQRPSVDVITGLIKANIPTRMAFQVSSRVDSRTVLDQMGAEQLLGQGDMLYLPPGSSLPERVHGAFVDDREVHRVVEHLKQHARPDYLDGITEGPATDDAGMTTTDSSDGEQDTLYDTAVKIVTETRRASVSSIQRRLKIGYNRAARIVEAMENAGIVSAMQVNGSREVLAPSPVDDK